MPSSPLLKNIEVIRQGRKSESVVQQMRDAINRGDLGPGAKLPSEPRLAESFGVSRTVIREAVRVLETRGYLEVRRGSAGGTFVSERVPDEFRPSRNSVALPVTDDGQLLEVRLSIEPGLMRTVACRSPRDLLDLRTALSHSANPNLTPARAINALTDFHITLAHLAANPLFGYFLAELVRPIRTSISPRVQDRAWVIECHAQHEAIARAVEEGDSERAVELMKAHLLFEHGADS
ncbi:MULTISPECIES: FadR/GntR family transcriptional regulator [unclassified Beijerinckia]|uniref:FadR/GntR family transcriptional regulator n=1 Tax=unclassified Beijerinckia TaxID=2638183 RepID=UPI00089B759D|nr:MULTISPECIES: FadR/GntR family transcriptional regulator [unclassified Beijerinckia]MDH7798916.1 GntR family transcriptional repressor for pyruvate dehydrogenase complex [Beijerinckia sp. GAS462]SED87085.1 transcriptional regulator, GntR family [Beijerinckia sp. 28-YEA-48]